MRINVDSLNLRLCMQLYRVFNVYNRNTRITFKFQMIYRPMLLNRIFLTLVSSLIITASFAQKIVYSEPERDDSRRMDFEIIGKVSGNFLIYKKIRSRNFVAVYNQEMEQIGKEDQD